MDMNRFLEIREKIPTSVDQFPEVAILVPVMCVIVGFILWMIGARLVRVAATITSITICGLLGAVVGRVLDGGVFAVVTVIFGAIVGGVLGWMAFRSVMAVLGATVLTALVPMGFIFFGNMQPPPLIEDVIEKVEKKTGVQINEFNENADPEKVAHAQESLQLVPEEIDLTGQLVTEGRNSTASGGESAEGVKEINDDESLSWEEKMAGRINLAIDAVVQLQQKYQAAVSEWWEGVSPAQRSSLIISMLMALVGGGLLGFLLPHITASGMTAITGSLLVLIGLDSLLVFYAPEQADKLHQHPRLVMFWFTVMSAIGGMIQWRFRTKKPES